MTNVFVSCDLSVQFLLTYIRENVPELYVYYDVPQPPVPVFLGSLLERIHFWCFASLVSLLVFVVEALLFDIHETFYILHSSYILRSINLPASFSSLFSLLKCRPLYYA